jgi:hypothetical protein
MLHNTTWCRKKSRTVGQQVSFYSATVLLCQCSTVHCPIVLTLLPGQVARQETLHLAGPHPRPPSGAFIFFLLYSMATSNSL